jgi:hypothetical protein
MVRIEDNQVIIYDDHQEIITHSLAGPGRENRYVGVKQRNSKVEAIQDAARIKARLLEIGEEMEDFMGHLKKCQPKSYMYHLRHIVSLTVNYTNDDMLCAIRRAINYKVFDSNAIEAFLEVNKQKKNEVKLFPSNK